MASTRSSSERPFSRCPRCGYALRGLPAEHSCPECGLRYDPHCALYRVTNPRTVLAVLSAVIVSGWISLTYLPHFANLSAASTVDRLGAVAGLLWAVLVPLWLWLIFRRFRQGYYVAVAKDVLIIRMPATSDAPLPWQDIAGASIKDGKPDGPQVVEVQLRKPGATITLGAVANIFPTHDDAQRFVDQVNDRVAACAGQSAASPPA